MKTKSRIDAGVATPGQGRRHPLCRSRRDALTSAGVDEKTIMRLAGWRSRSMFDRYSIRNNQDVADGLRRLAQAAQERATARRTRQRRGIESQV